MEENFKFKKVVTEFLLIFTFLLLAEMSYCDETIKTQLRPF